MWGNDGYWYVGLAPEESCTTGTSKLRYADATPTTVYALGSDWEEVNDDGTFVPVASIEVVYSVELSGTLFQTSREGRYTRSGSCDGAPQFTCENCNGVQQYLWYNATGALWLVSPEDYVCQVTRAGIYYPTTNPRWPGAFSSIWREWTGNSWYTNNRIAVDHVKFGEYYCDDTCANEPDGICSDGFAASRGSSCPCGTDCTDCGVRTICPSTSPTLLPFTPELTPTPTPLPTPLPTPMPTPIPTVVST